MTVRTKLVSFLPDLIAALFILLFVYAATSKLLDFEQFRIQLGQSPLLTAYAEPVAWGVPLLELGIAGLLCFQSWRRHAFYAAFSLMVMFTTYILLILNFSDYIPCSCGGVLEKLGWTEHVFFNLGFILLAAIGILRLESKTTS